MWNILLLFKIIGITCFLLAVLFYVLGEIVTTLEKIVDAFHKDSDSVANEDKPIKP